MRKSGDGLKKIICFLCIICVLGTSYALAENTSFNVTFATIENGAKNVSIEPRLYFLFSHRIDPCDNEFTLNGTKEKIESFKISGRELEIFLNSPLEYETEYTLSLNSVNDIYGESPVMENITFETESRLIISDEVYEGVGEDFAIKKGDTIVYRAKITNLGKKEREPVFILSLKRGEVIEEIKVQRKKVSGGCSENIDITVEVPDYDGEYKVKIIPFADINTFRILE